MKRRLKQCMWQCPSQGVTFRDTLFLILSGSDRSHSRKESSRDCRLIRQEALRGLGHLQKAISLSTSERWPWQLLTGRLRKIQVTKIPNQGVTSDVSEAGYPFGQALCTLVVNTVYCWVPSVFNRIRYDLD
jgi:hypothetical protein